jgi:nicotinate phosphoribosyltransferase
MQSALFTDFYELTMAQGYWRAGDRRRAVFDMFFRRQPFGGGYAVFAGLEPLLRALEDFRFSGEDLAWLDSLGIFEKGFLDYIASFRFSGSIWAMPEGSVIFPQEPLVRVEADLVEAQIIEGVVLNFINFQSLVATKSTRVWRASGYGRIMEFGLRRAQGLDGAESASRAAYIGGAESTSNALAGRLFGIPVSGTMAHSWVMTFPSELEAFEAYAEIYPDKSVFLIDTYDSLDSGIKNAIEAGHALAARGKRFGVRLDSGDIDYLSRAVRKTLDEAGFEDAFIVVSNELDENIIERLVGGGTPVDLWGVGTSLVTGGNEAAFTGVYKLAAVERGGSFVPTMKFSDNPEKSTNPGVKQVWRLYDDKGSVLADCLCLEEEEGPRPGVELHLHHPSGDWRETTRTPARVEPLLEKVMSEGRILDGRPTLADIRSALRGRLSCFDTTYLRLLNPHVYKVSISDRLRALKLGFIEEHFKDAR